jgi:hypothetical protein
VNGRRGEAGNCAEVGGNWRKSTRSGGSGECVEVASGYRKPSRSVGNGNCVEAASGTRAVLVRDTTDREGTVLTFPAAAWSAFAAALRGES